MEKNDLLMYGGLAAAGIFVFSQLSAPEDATQSTGIAQPLPGSNVAQPTAAQLARQQSISAAVQNGVPLSNDFTDAELAYILAEQKKLNPNQIVLRYVSQSPAWHILPDTPPPVRETNPIQEQLNRLRIPLPPAPIVYTGEQRGLQLQYALLQAAGSNNLTADEWNFYLAQLTGKEQPEPETYLPADIDRNSTMPVNMYAQYRGLAGVRRFGISPLSGLTLNMRYRGGMWGMGDVLSDAQANLQRAGYSNVTCRTERIYLPMADPATGLNYYTQNVCSAPGYIGAFDADVVANQSQYSTPGTGVDLAAERRYLMSQGDGPGTGQSYIEAFSGPWTQVTAQVNPGGDRSIMAPAPVPDTKTMMQTLDSAAAARAKAQSATTGGGTGTPATTLTPPPTTTGTGAPAADHTDWLKEPVVLIGLAGLALVLVMSMSKGN